MTLQQLKYLLAIDRCRNFARAAEELDVTQPTLSAMLVKLEEELGVTLFERSNKQVRPTAAGLAVIRQAERSLREIDRIHELLADFKEKVEGPLSLAVAPSIAPYIVPQFIRRYTEDYPKVELSIVDQKADEMMGALLQGKIDAGIGIGNQLKAGVLEVPLYTESFWVYLSEDCGRKLPVFKPEQLESEQMWVMKEAQCLRNSAFSFCKARSKGHQLYEAGCIDTLVRIVDANGGYTIIPEMHLPFLTEQQRANVRRIDGNSQSQRRVSLYFREEEVRQRLLDSIAQALLSFLPKRMVDDHLVKFGIRL
ncbi:LysR family transcriptional regulator [gut metagenome]|uniref:LysR family transcriptional regulator n=1 Tax=gut metagenome TaxID=749906 RepID=J9GWW7_9ZZZZ